MQDGDDPSLQAKKYALSVLERKDRTEHELIDIMRRAGHEEEHAFEALEYVKKYSYVDDCKYANNYIRNHMPYKSKIYIHNKLLQKGVDSDLIRDAFLSLEDEACDVGGEPLEVLALRVELAKRTRNMESLSRKDRHKISSAMFRKGFPIDMIRKEISLLGLKEGTEDADGMHGMYCADDMNDI